MKYKPLQRQPWNLYEIHTLTGTTQEIYMKYIPLTENNPGNYMKYIPLQRDHPGIYMKYIPLQAQTCKLHEIHTLTGTTL